MNDTIYEPSLKAIVRSSTRITAPQTDEVRELVLTINEPSFRFSTGQSIAVLVPGQDEFGSKQHKRMYSIAKGHYYDSQEGVDITLLVKRCFYIDDFNGEEYPGRASNYLCDAQPGDSITITGPYHGIFSIPKDSSANILMIGTGTGIAPFRAFIEQIYQQRGGWEGQVRLFYGAKSGLDLLYMNDKNNDLVNYYSQDTFQAFHGITQKYLSSDEKGLKNSLKDNLQEAWDLMQQPNTYIFLAGLENIAESLDSVMSDAAGSEEAWLALKLKMKSQGRWSKLLYS